MIIKAYSKNEAILIAKEKNISVDNIELKTIKEPILKFKGLIKRKGEFIINTTKNNKLIKDNTISTSKDGYVELKNGKVVVKNPIDNGRYPYIIAEDPNIDVIINGRIISGITPITDKDIIDIRPKNIKAKTEIKVDISDNKVYATLYINKIKGIKYKVVDSKKDIRLKIKSDIEEITHKQVEVSECINELLKKGVKPQFINTEAIEELIKLPNGGNKVVAKGIEPIYPKKTEVKYYFNNKNEIRLNNEEIGLNIVQIGDVLAIKTKPAMQGKEGMTVTGEIIKVDNVKDETLNIGNGVVLLENGLKAVAAESGRPIIKNGKICIIPSLIISKDLDKETGDLDFEGDIIIKGNVMDNMKIKSSGKVVVTGNVYNSTITAKENVNIIGRVIRSKISAGLSIANFFCIVPQFNNIKDIINKLISSVQENSFKINNKQLFNIIKSEKKVLENCKKEINKVIPIIDADEVNKIKDILNELDLLIRKINLLHLDNVNDIKNFNEKIEKYINLVSKKQEVKVNIGTRYAQNSVLQSYGDITIYGEGTYQSTLFAKESITFRDYRSHVKGGILIAGETISAGVVGSKSGIRTYCKIINPKGKIDGQFEIGSVINIAGDMKIVK